ncbi:MAG: hypothetical protein HYU37_07625 [Acidobacteria bacterium]|nr:hypothetical protein [Acidobacteriota bacterium]
MATLEERVAYLEGQMAEQAHTFVAIRDVLKAIDQRIDGVNQRIDRVEQRIDRVEQRIDRLEQRMDARFDAVDRRFLWIIGIQITTLVAVVGAVLSRG